MSGRRPLVAGTTGSVTEAIYGLILAMSVIAVSAEYDSSNAGLVGVTVLVTGVVFWLAHVYARVLAGSLTTHRTPNRSEVRDAIRHDWPLVEVTVPLVLILALGALDVVPTRQRFSPRRLPSWWNWSLPVHTRRACQEPACSGRSRQPSLPEPSAARSSCSKPSCTDRDGPHTYGTSRTRATVRREEWSFGTLFGDWLPRSSPPGVAPLGQLRLSSGREARVHA